MPCHSAALRSSAALRVVLLLRQRRINEAPDIAPHFGVLRVVNVDHVARFVEAEADAGAR